MVVTAPQVRIRRHQTKKSYASGADTSTNRRAEFMATAGPGGGFLTFGASKELAAPRV